MPIYQCVWRSPNSASSATLVWTVGGTTLAVIHRDVTVIVTEQHRHYCVSPNKRCGCYKTPYGYVDRIFFLKLCRFC